MLSREATNTNTDRVSTEPTIYRTRGEHANQYTSDAVATDYNKIEKKDIFRTSLNSFDIM